MSLRGEDLAYAGLDHIRENPEEWDQASWFCGSSACFAGRVVMIAGENLVTQNVGRRAAELLGWSDSQADHVFLTMTGDFDVLERAVKRVLSGEIL